MYSLEEFDKQKTRVFKYILYKKRTEQEIRQKFRNDIEENMLEDIIEYFKEANYINDYDFIERQVREYMALKTMSIKEIKYKLAGKGIERKIMEKYINEHYDELKEYEKKCIEKIRMKKSGTMEEQEINQYLYRKGYQSE